MDQTPETQDNTTKAVTPPPGVTPPPAVTPKDIANGVTRPKLGSLTARVWAICDELSAAANAPAERAKVILAGVAEGINAATIATQHGKWRKYHGLVADSPEAKAEKAAVAAKTKAEKAAVAAKTKAEKAAVAAKTKAEKEIAAKAKQAAVTAAAKARIEAVTAVVEGDVTVEAGVTT